VCWESVTAGYELEFEDDFDGHALDERRWLPFVTAVVPASVRRTPPEDDA
jgi:hypothetical protein